MQLMRNAKRKFDFLTFFKFLWAFNWRAILLGYSLVFILFGLGSICIHSYCENSMALMPMITSKSFFYTVLSTIAIPVTIYSLKWSTTKKYKTFEVVWNDEPPKNIFDKQFFYSACAFTASILASAILFHIFMARSILEQTVIEQASGEIIEAIFLFIFIKNNWFNFQLKKL